MHVSLGTEVPNSFRSAFTEPWDARTKSSSRIKYPSILVLRVHRMPVPLVTAYVTQKCKVHDALVPSPRVHSTGDRGRFSMGVLIKIDDTHWDGWIAPWTHMDNERTTAPRYVMSVQRESKKKERGATFSRRVSGSEFRVTLTLYVTLTCNGTPLAIVITINAPLRGPWTRFNEPDRNEGIPKTGLSKVAASAMTYDC